jgi:hypothetical protein
MDRITIGFSKPKDMKFKFFAWLIMKGYGTPYSHVYLKLNSEKYERNLFYQASGKAVNFMSEKYFYAHSEVVEEFVLEMDKQQAVEMIKFAIDTCGAPYGLKECFWMGYVRIGEILGQKWSAPTSDKNHTFVCSELASYVLENFAGKQIPKLPDDMTPLDVYNLMKSL